MNDLWAAALFAKRLEKDVVRMSVCPALIHAKNNRRANIQAMALCLVEWPSEDGWIEHNVAVMKISDADLQASGVKQ